MKYITTERLLEIAREHFGIGHASAAQTMFEHFADELEEEILENIKSSEHHLTLSGEVSP